MECVLADQAAARRARRLAVWWREPGLPAPCVVPARQQCMARREELDAKGSYVARPGSFWPGTSARLHAQPTDVADKPSACPRLPHSPSRHSPKPNLRFLWPPTRVFARSAQPAPALSVKVLSVEHAGVWTHPAPPKWHREMVRRRRACRHRTKATQTWTLSDRSIVGR